MHNTVPWALLAACLPLTLNAVATAQWTITNLHPSGATGSAASSVLDGAQVGAASYAGVTHATRWSGTAASAVDLHPNGSSYSSATSAGVGPGSQAGWGYLGNLPGQRALHWSRGTGSLIDLTPEEASDAAVWGGDGQSMVGWARFGANRAVLWHDADPDDFDTLHPPTNPTHSYATAVGDGQQVGWVVTNSGSTKACVWSGTAASYVNLDPGVSTHSAAFGAGGGKQVGFAKVLGEFRASLWSGTAASWVNLHPIVAVSSAAYAIHGEHVVGKVSIAGVDHASLWSSTAASWVDLHAQLPPNYLWSVAADIFVGSDTTFIVGNAFNTMTNRGEAILWTKPHCPGPFSADLDCDGVVSGADLGILLSAWGTSSADLNGDAMTDGADLGLLLGDWS